MLTVSRYWISNNIIRIQRPDCSSESFSNLLKLTQLVSGRAKIQTQACMNLKTRHFPEASLKDSMWVGSWWRGQRRDGWMKSAFCSCVTQWVFLMEPTSISPSCGHTTHCELLAGSEEEARSRDRSSSEYEMCGVFIEVGAWSNFLSPLTLWGFFSPFFAFLGERRLLRLFGWGFGKMKLEDKINEIIWLLSTPSWESVLKPQH